MTRHRHSWRLHLLAAACAMASGPALAMGIDTGSDDWALRLDTTVKASTIYRLKNADPALTDSTRQLVPGVPASAFPQALNFNAGDDNFRRRGFVSERLDLLAEFDAIFRRSHGLRLSAAGWYDAVYHRGSDASDPVNGQRPNNEFSAQTRKMAGGKAELLDAFVFTGVDLGDGRKLTARLGRHALQYGESLFFGDNGIARAQGPVDIAKLLASPNAQFKEIIRPVPQLSAQLQLGAGLSLGGYVQFRWEADRLPAAGSYFSTANIPWGSTLPEAVNIPPPAPIAGQYLLLPGDDIQPRDSGQFGLQLKWRLGETDLGLYAARYHDKGGQLRGALNLANKADSRWYYEFPEDVKTAGFSVSHSLGDVNLALEASLRSNQPLRNANIIVPSVAPNPPLATGRTAHVNLSWLATLGPSFIAREASFLGELAWNRVLKTHDPAGELDHGRTREATAIQMIFSPSYRQVLPGLDLNVPLGLRYTLQGQSSVGVWDSARTGNVSLGLEGNYLGVWQFTLNWVHYIGRAVPFVDYSPLLSGGSPQYGNGNPLADRDHIAFSIRRSF